MTTSMHHSTDGQIGGCRYKSPSLNTHSERYIAYSKLAESIRGLRLSFLINQKHLRPHRPRVNHSLESSVRVLAATLDWYLENYFIA